jgi:hypothetical protein
MKVKELIESLQKQDQDARVVIRGYEGGVNDVDGCEVVTIAVNANTAWYYGKHETVTEGCYHDNLYKDKPREKAIQIG